MSEFSNRIRAQREILRRVNSVNWPKEALHSLSGKAIDRWINSNRIEPSCSLALLLRTTSEKLFFLANKSQEQISEDYKSVASEVGRLAADIEREVKSI